MKSRINVSFLAMLVCLLMTVTFPTGCKKRTPKPGEDQGTQTPTMTTDSTMSESASDFEQSRFTEEEMMRQKIEREKQDVLQDVGFDFDQWSLSMKSRAMLSTIGDWMLKNPQIKLLIEGHCDDRGTVEYNLALGQKRANAVKEYLVDYGITTSRLSTISYGEERPLVIGQDEAAWEKNRRAHFIVIE